MIFNFSPFSQSFAEQIVNEEAEIFYEIHQDNTASFNYIIELSTEPGVATAISQYTMSLPFQDFNLSTIKSSGEDLPVKIKTENDLKQLVFKFNNRILNYTNPITIEIKGETKDNFMREIENTRIIILPGSISNIKVKKIEVLYPKSFGEISNYGNQWILQHDAEKIKLKSFSTGKTINLIWGDKIAYDFQINKKLTNGENEPRKTFDLNIPKFHNNQKVFLTHINPLPNFAYQDAEGNLFFSYELEPNSEINIEIAGQIEIDLFQENKKEINLFEKPILTETIGYWLLDNEYELNRLNIHLSKEGITENSIDKMDVKTKELFYRVAYDYVVDRLDFANVRTTSMESNIRQGANNAVLHRVSAAPEDYVDLLTAIYRHYDVPTRMVEGYVIMLNQGFYHSWLEFWDEESGWQNLDPALEDYTNGDFFKTDLFNHIIILSRGYNYIRPRMTFFEKDDFVITFPEIIINESLSVYNNATINPLKKTQDEILGILEIKNTGNTIISMGNFTNHEQILLGNYNALQLIVPGQTINVPFIYKPEVKNTNEKILLEYTSINGEKIYNPINIDIQEEKFWWWNPLITTLKITIVSITVYIIYLISSKIFIWIKRYYQ